MTLSFRTRLVIAHVVVVVAALAAMALLENQRHRSWLIARQQSSLERLAGAGLGRVASATEGFPELADSLGVAWDCRVTLIARDGRVRGDSNVPRAALATVENHATRPEVRAALGGHVGRAVRRSRTTGFEQVYAAVALPRTAALAVLRLSEPLAPIIDLNGTFVRLSLVAGVAALLLSLPLVLVLSAGHGRRIAELERVTMRLRAQDASARAREQPADELGRLGRAINDMAADLRTRLAALARERDERERILAHMSDGVALVDAADRVVHANRSIATILGAAMTPAAGTSFQDFARSPELADLLRAARTHEQPMELDLRLWTPEQRRVRVTATRLHGSEDGAVILVLHDLTEVELLNQVRQDFVANVSHELKTPLTSVRGYAETLLDGGLEDAEHRDGFVRIIRDQATRLESLVEDLLSLAELERPDTRLRLEPFDLRDSVQRQCAILAGPAERAGLELRLESGPPVPVVADRLRVDQVIANLIDNALKYTERGGVRIRIGTADAQVWCEVQDTGSGIPVEDLSRVFERFYRVDKARSREKGGTGLGLAIVKHILALHGGRITAASTVGEGSTFRFELPLRPAGAGEG
jgi:two-component system, OmpR family, phosphate regulon sensor histidine kinase PhoR